MKRRHIVIMSLSLLAFMLVVISSCTKSPSHSEIKRVIGEYMKKEPIPDWFCSQETIDAERKTLPKDVMVAEYKGANVDEIRIIKIEDQGSLDKGGFMPVTVYLKGSFSQGKFRFSGKYVFPITKTMYGELAVGLVPKKVS